MNTIIIDDDIFFGNILSEKLKKYGYDIKLIFQYKENICKKDLENIDVIFIDYHLIDAGCNKFLKYIKENYPDIFIVLMSDNPDAHTFSNGLFHYFFKKDSFCKLGFKSLIIKESINDLKSLRNRFKMIYYAALFIFIYSAFQLF